MVKNVDIDPPGAYSTQSELDRLYELEELYHTIQNQESVQQWKRRAFEDACSHPRKWTVLI